jgi:hypothetical protein
VGLGLLPTALGQGIDSSAQEKKRDGGRAREVQYKRILRQLAAIGR